MKVVVDREKCKAHGRCYTFAPDAFERGPKGKGVARHAHVSDDDADLLGAAETGFMMCPVGAISVDEE
ncbi:MAG: ferredoxin [Alphaproteobacteria bacterium]|nr:ferredoxin [Alphaproteobacteria bacterium]